MKYRVPFIKPEFPSVEAVSEDYNKILESNWFTNFGPFEKRFSDEIARYIGDEYYAATFSSATSGLIACIFGVLGKGDGKSRVLIPSFTFAAGADALVWCGYIPTFVDIEPEGLQMDLDETQKIVSSSDFKEKIAGILFCNAFGVGARNIAEWEKIAANAQLPLIIDSAAGFGSLYSENRKLGSAGDCEVFSFHATKPFAIGEGGAVVSRDKALIKKLESIQNFGFEKGNATSLGFNGKLQELNAAIGLRQFQTFDGALTRRKAVLSKYKAKLDPNKCIFQDNIENASLCFATIVLKRPDQRGLYLASLDKAGIEAKTYYSPLHQQDIFKKYTEDQPMPVTEKIGKSVISLPVHDKMKDKDIDLIINTLNKAGDRNEP